MSDKDKLKYTAIATVFLVACSIIYARGLFLILASFVGYLGYRVYTKVVARDINRYQEIQAYKRRLEAEITNKRKVKI
jgi:hypothetical protein